MTEPFSAGAGGLSERLTTMRRSLAQRSPEAFARTYLPAHFRLPPSPMHREMFALCAGSLSSRGARIAIAAPRGHAKTTVASLAFVLYCALFRVEAFIVLISNTADQACGLLDTIKRELEENALILQDFPEAAEPPGSTPPAQRWRRDEIITRNGVRILALGAGQKIRGRRHAQHRPGLIVLDDIESEAEVASAEVREARLNWFQRSVLKAGSTGHTNVIVVGTLLHYDSLLAQLLGAGMQAGPTVGWTTKTYRAVTAWSEEADLWQKWEAIYCQRDESEDNSGPQAALAFFRAHESSMLAGTQVLWPEKESYYDLMVMRLTEGRASFDAEKQNDPVDASTCLFRMDQAQYWDDQYASVDELLRDLGAGGYLYGACDPSLGRQGRSRDDSAIVTLLRHRKTGVLYVLEADIRKRSPLEIIEASIEYHRRFKYSQFAFEANQFQDILADELVRVSREHGVHVPVKKVIHSSDKHGRIQSLEPLIATGTLRFSRRHRTLLDELRQFPKAAHDDGPDALEMAVAVSRRPKMGIGFLDMRTGEAEWTWFSG